MNKNIKKRIILYGQQNLQNSILVGYLNQHTGAECQLASQPYWKAEWNKDIRPTLILIDAELSRLEKINDLLEQIYQQTLDLRVAFYAVPHSHPVEKLIAWPMVAGLFHDDTTQQQLCKGIDELFLGDYCFSRQLIADYLYRTRQKPKPKLNIDTPLTKREVQILQQTATGATNTEIAEQLNVSMHTVKTHMYNLFKKLGVVNRMQAVNWAQDHLEEFDEVTYKPMNQSIQ